MSDIVLRGVPVELTSSSGREFVVDAVRAAEGLLDDVELLEKYQLSPAELNDLANDTAVRGAIRAERERRVYTGRAARESAAKIHAKAPAVLGDILNDKAASPRHRIESAKELRATATGSAETESTGSTSEKFIIQINLGADTETYIKEITPMKPLPPTHEGFKINDDE